MEVLKDLTEEVLKYKEFIILGSVLFLIILIIIIIILFVKNSKLNKRLNAFTKGSSASSLEEIITKRFAELEQLKIENNVIRGEISKIKENLILTYQKVGIVKYDAFKEMGGKLSFVMTLLDDNNDGLMINSVYSTREGCYVYLKEIIKGESFIELSEEESKSLNDAKQNDMLK